MKHTAAALLCLSCALATAALAQKSVPITSEPHHHLVYTGERLRVFRVEVPAHGSTLIHEHAVDYFWIAVGPSEFVHAAVGKADEKVVAQDGSVHFTRGGFAHLARIEGAQSFHNVTIELLQPQMNPRNLCEPVLRDQPVDCATAMTRAATLFPGADARPEFETDQVRVTLITVAPGAKLELARRIRPVVLVAVDDAAGSIPVTCPVVDQPKGIALQSRSGNTYRVTGRSPCSLHNATGSRVRFLAVESGTAPR